MQLAEPWYPRGASESQTQSMWELERALAITWWVQPPHFTDEEAFFRCVCRACLASLLSLMLSRLTESSRGMGHLCQLISLICGQYGSRRVSVGKGRNCRPGCQWCGVWAEGLPPWVEGRMLPVSHVCEKVLYEGRKGESFVCPAHLVLIWQRNLKFSPFFPTQGRGSCLSSALTCHN